MSIVDSSVVRSRRSWIRRSSSIGDASGSCRSMAASRLRDRVGRALAAPLGLRRPQRVEVVAHRPALEAALGQRGLVRVGHGALGLGGRLGGGLRACHRPPTLLSNKEFGVDDVDLGRWARGRRIDRGFGAVHFVLRRRGVQASSRWTNRQVRASPPTLRLMWPWPVVSSARRIDPGTEDPAVAAAHLDLHRSRQVDDELPPGGDVEVEVVGPSDLPELHAGTRPALGDPSCGADVGQLDRDVLEVGAAVGPRVDAHDLHRPDGTRDISRTFTSRYPAGHRSVATLGRDGHLAAGRPGRSRRGRRARRAVVGRR